MADRPFEILVVEDDAAVRRMIEMSLSRLGAVVRAVGDGAQALRSIAENPPDLVLLDLMMPGVNGFQFLRVLREGEHADLPVVVVSAKNDPTDHFWARRLGVVSYLPKPFRTEDLVAAVDTARGLRGSTDPRGVER